jgi:uncharacterized membrane protein YeaQ/YmgE (transglycosylase-associated protein family)
MGIIAWIIIGLVAGWLAGQIMKGSGYGLVGDLVLGLIGAIVGGWLVGRVAPAAEPTGIVGGIIIATAGALVLIFVARMFRGRGIARVRTTSHAGGA